MHFAYENMMETIEDGTSLEWIYDRLPAEALLVMHLRFLVPLTPSEVESSRGFDTCALVRFRSGS